MTLTKTEHGRVRTSQRIDPDGELQRTLNGLWDRIYELERRIEALEKRSAGDGGERA